MIYTALLTILELIAVLLVVGSILMLIFLKTVPEIKQVATSREKKLETLFLPCDTCGRELGPDMLDCFERQKMECPFKVLQSRGQRKKTWLIPVVMGCAVAICGLGVKYLSWPMPDFITRWEPGVWLLMVLAGLTSAVAGSIIEAIRQTTDSIRIYNRKTRQVWQQKSYLVYLRYRTTVSSFQPVPFSESLSLQYSASLSLLAQIPDSNDSISEWEEFATDVYYLTLLNQLRQGEIKLYYAGVSDSYQKIMVLLCCLLFGMLKGVLTSARKLMQPGMIRPVLMLAPGFQTQAHPGSLEEKIYHAVSQMWKQRNEWFLNPGSGYLLLENYVSDMIEKTLGKQHSSVGKVLVADILGPDASKQGLCQLKGWRKKTVNISSHQKDSFADSCQSLKEFEKEFSLSYPTVAAYLRKNIQQGISSSTKSSG